MLRNYLLIAWRNLAKNRVFSLINLLGLAIGLAACLSVLQYVTFQLSYDDFHSDAQNLYRIGIEWQAADKPAEKAAQNHNATGPALKRDFPEVVAFARLRPWFGDVVVSHTAGLDPNTFPATAFRLSGFTDSSRVA